MNSTKQRILSLDILRVLACMMVVIMHSPMPLTESSNIFLSTISYLTSPCIGLFFMVSGALLLPTSSENGTMGFIRKRLNKIVLPTLTWTFVYLICDILTNEKGINESLTIQILSIPFSAQGYGTLWFMYTLTGLYLLAPIISPWLRQVTEKELNLYLCLWLLTLCYPLLGLYLKINEGISGILYYFTGYAGYFLLGYYMRYYGNRIKVWFSCLGFIVAIIAPIVVKLNGWQVDFYHFFWYLSIVSVLMCIGWWKAIITMLNYVHIPQYIEKCLVLVSNLSFGIYLSHILIMRYVVWKWDWIINIQSYALRTLMIILLSLVMTIAVCWIISFLPRADWIIGYSRRKNKSKVLPLC